MALRHYMLSGLLFCGFGFAAASQSQEDKTQPVVNKEVNETDEQKLNQLVNKIKDFSARFKQTIIAGKGKTDSNIEGLFKLKQPGRFRWETTKPYRQIVVSDGKAVYTFDPDLEQALIQDLKAVIGDTPALLFSGDIKISQHFKVKLLRTTPSKTQFELLPQKVDSTLESVNIEFTRDILSAMHIVDAFGQKTDIVFNDIVVKPIRDEKIFELVLGDDIDVIDQRKPTEKASR